MINASIRDIRSFCSTGPMRPALTHTMKLQYQWSSHIQTAIPAGTCLHAPLHAEPAALAVLCTSTSYVTSTAPHPDCSPRVGRASQGYEQQSTFAAAAADDAMAALRYACRGRYARRVCTTLVVVNWDAPRLLCAVQCHPNMLSAARTGAATAGRRLRAPAPLLLFHWPYCPLDCAQSPMGRRVDVQLHIT
ncbi:hypothetical protein CERZMDRAFT_86991 [Cercospora zeae-maydis SCOH1-5]|uniref:Uncharacterized protein n=1 Tax=Cercospora zeae-maydis SCOH1-5 TaxID=717836 RepID=A0A6A6F8E4_9PEZI|nr:hypothetical protein CERZMDRAFT_86991 [Cercospora zeae-maydis SCOH1-5]